MIETIKDKMNNVNIDKLNLFFILRAKQRNKIKYSVLQTNTTESVRRELLNIINEKLKNLISENHNKYNKYDPVVNPDDNTIQTINSDDINNFNEIRNKFNQIDLDFFNLTEFKKVWAYAISIKDPDIIFFRKFVPSQYLKKNRLIALLFKDGVFNDIADDILAIQREFDCIYYNGMIYILNKENFEMIFSYLEEWRDNIDKSISKLEEKKIIKNITEFYGNCLTDRKKVRKLHQILNSDFIEKIDNKLIQKINKDYELSLKFDSNGLLTVEQKDMWKILRLLDDDHLNSSYSYNKYIAHSKEKKTI